MGLFGEKKNKPFSAFHYEGLPDFDTDYPCLVDVTSDSIIIKRSKPEVTVTLPIERITAISPMEEKNFMMKYHGNSGSRKILGNKRHFVVIEYQNKEGEFKHFSLWALTHQAMPLIGLQNIKKNNAPRNHEL
ncbi:MAG: hypothetical protein VB018_09370 [Lachnospiraceae bacterium]|nr:hypothetical protein [Lachnospiraceae bacterium]